MTVWDDRFTRWRSEREAAAALEPWVASRLDESVPKAVPVPDHDPFDDELIDLAMYTGVYDDDSARLLLALRPGRLVRQVMPSASRRALLWNGLYTCWLTAVDDGLADHAGTPLAEVAATADRVLRSGAAPGDDSPTARCLGALRDDVAAAGGAGFLPVLAGHVADNMRAFRRKHEILREGRLPGLADFLELRTYDVSVVPGIAIYQWHVDPVEPAGTGAALVGEINRLSALVAALDNDLNDLSGDLARGEVMNTVLAVAENHHVPLPVACRTVVGMLEALWYRLQGLLGTLRAASDVSPGLVRRAQAAVDWPLGMGAWHRAAPRYGDPTGGAERMARVL